MKLKTCSNIGGQCTDDMGVSVTDISIWDEALTGDELIKWTTCRSYRIELLHKTDLLKH